jgi:hypothetical protein
VAGQCGQCGWAVSRAPPLQGYLVWGPSAPLGPYSRTMHRAPWWSQEGGLFLMSEVPLYSSSFESLKVVAVLINE